MEEKIIAWIARDKCGNLFLSIGCKPHKYESSGAWIIEDVQNSYETQLESESYLQVKWEDEEPTEVELTIKIY